MPSLINMKKIRRKIFVAIAFASTLGACANNALKGVSLDTAKSLLLATKENQSTFEVKSTHYEFTSSITVSAFDGWMSKPVKTSDLKVTYDAPYLISDEKTPFVLKYELIINSPYNQTENSRKVFTVTKEENSYIVKENNNFEHVYTPSADSFLTNFMNLPNLINSNNIASLDIAEQYMNSIGKPNALTSFEALSSGKDDFVLTFTGESLSVNNLYDEDPNMPGDVEIESFSVSSTNKRVDSYESKYSYPNSTIKIDGKELPLLGLIKVGFVYEA